MTRPTGFNGLARSGYVGVGRSGTGTAPSIVQQTGGKNVATVTLPGTPTVGNLLVVMIVGIGVPATPPPGFTNILYDPGATVNSQYGFVFVRWVKAGDGASVTAPLNSSPYNIFFFELTGVSSFEALNGPAGVSGNTMTAPVAVGNGSYAVVAFECDNGVTYSSMSGATLLYNPGTGGTNHTAVFAGASASGAVTATFASGPASAYYVQFLAYGVGSVAADDLAVVPTASTTGSVRTNRATNNQAYCEIAVGAGLTGTSRIGLANISFSPSGLLGVDANGIGYDSGGTVKLNNVTVATLAAYTSADNIGVAVDRSRQLLWFRINGGNWNNDVIANQNPANGTGGISISSLSGSLYLAWGALAVATITAYIDPTRWVYTAPSGFSSISDDIGITDYLAGHCAALSAPVPFGARNLSAILRGATWPLYSVLAPGSAGAHVTGQVQETGTPVSGRLVMAFDRVTHELLGTCLSDGSGNFNILVKGRSAVLVVAVNPTSYNALVFDNVASV